MLSPRKRSLQYTPSVPLSARNASSVAQNTLPLAQDPPPSTQDPPPRDPDLPPPAQDPPPLAQDPPPQNPYMILLPNSSKPDDDYTKVNKQSRNQSGNQSGNENEANSEIADLLSKQFTPDQLEQLLEMLKKMKVKGGDPDSSLKSQDLGYLVTKTANTLTDNL